MIYIYTHTHTHTIGIKKKGYTNVSQQLEICTYCSIKKALCGRDTKMEKGLLSDGE